MNPDKNNLFSYEAQGTLILIIIFILKKRTP
jgi:hypothetical protein